MPVGVYDAKQTLESFLSGAAAKQPTPGGGSVAALVGALAASMGEMVLNYSVGRTDVAEHSALLQGSLVEMNRARSMLVELMIEDQAAYEALTAARKAKDAGKFAPALLACIRVPQSVAATAVAVLELCDRVAPCMNPHLSSDLAVCCELCMATTRCAVYNLRANLSDVTDPAEKRKLEQGTARSISQATQLIQRVLPKIWARHGE
jgi:formiminotetrahydrofolate cyclodeaminase